MIYQTYLHPGVAKRLIAQSKARRAVVLAKRDGTYREPTHDDRARWLQNAMAGGGGNPYSSGGIGYGGLLGAIFCR